VSLLHTEIDLPPMVVAATMRVTHSMAGRAERVGCVGLRWCRHRGWRQLYQKSRRWSEMGIL